MEESKKLYRSSTDRIIGGVCGGLGEYFEIDPIIFRLIFLLLAIFGGGGIVIYLIMWILIPESGEKRSKDTGDNVKQGANKMASELKTVSRTNNFRLLGGLIIILIGFSFLLEEFFPAWHLGLDKLWPLIIVAIGIAILARGKDDSGKSGK